jgi:hypothetical protein
MSPSNHSLAPTPTYPITSPLSLTGNPPTCCTNFNVLSVSFLYGEMGQLLSKHMNGHQSTCGIVNSYLQVPVIRPNPTSIPELPVHVIHKLLGHRPNHVYHQFETAY